MAMETEDSSRMTWFQGTVSSITMPDCGSWQRSPWRMLQVDICCFDKTGTLTSDDMEFLGVVGTTESVDTEDMEKVPSRALEILASCHSLVFADNKLVSDRLEKAALKGIEWTYKSDDKAMPKRGGGNPVQIIHRYHFASYLKSMSVIARVQDDFFSFVKVSEARSLERDAVESDLIFAGFAIKYYIKRKIHRS